MPVTPRLPATPLSPPAPLAEPPSEPSLPPASSPLPTADAIAADPEGGRGGPPSHVAPVGGQVGATVIGAAGLPPVPGVGPLPPPLAPPAPRSSSRGMLAAAVDRAAVPPSAEGSSPAGLAAPLAPASAPASAPVVLASSSHVAPLVQTMLGGAAPQAEALTRRCASCDARYPADFLVCPRDASPLVDESPEALTDPLVGKLVGETYQIVRVVGEGGMGRVYEARHLRLKERRFAIKTLHADLAHNAEIVARFMREAESASSLSHPNVAFVLDVHHLPDGTPYLVSELLEGEELARHVEARGPLSPRAAAAVGRQLCSALAAAHARGIVHRDLKPENVFVLRAGGDLATLDEGGEALTVKVLDFGISKAGGSDRTGLTRTGLVMGTPSYMAPEQARGRPVDHRADIYSLGATLYFALTGLRPFDADDPGTTLSMVLTREPTRLRTIDRRIPEVLELAVQRAMAKEPADRFATMVDFAGALAALAAVEGDGPRSRALVAREGEDVGAVPSGALGVARSLLAFPTPPPSQAAALAKAARPTIVVASVVLGLWLIGGSAAALGGLVRVLHAGEITLTESVLLVVGCLFAAATPAALYVLHVKKRIWDSSVRALSLATDLRRTTIAALVAYGGLSIVARVAHTILVRDSGALASGVWDIVLFAVSLVVAGLLGGAGLVLRNLRRRSA